MRLTSSWIRVLFAAFTLALLVGSVAHVASLNAPHLQADGGGGPKTTGG